jgi:hypothetical protein
MDTGGTLSPPLGEIHLGLLALAALPALASAGQVYKTSTTLVVKATKAEGKLSSSKAGLPQEPHAGRQLVPDW